MILFLTTISVNFDVNYRQFKYFFCLSRKNARCALATQNKKKVYNDRCQQVYNPFLLLSAKGIKSHQSFFRCPSELVVLPFALFPPYELCRALTIEPPFRSFFIYELSRFCFAIRGIALAVCFASWAKHCAIAQKWDHFKKTILLIICCRQMIEDGIKKDYKAWFNRTY